MKHLFIVSLSLSLSISSSAQRFSVSGTVQDTIGNELVAATVILMDTDSILIDYTLSNSKGEFIFKNLMIGKYLIKITYLSFFPVTYSVDVSDENVQMGEIKMEEISTQLMEVVIRDAKAPLKLRGDTVEYDISQFKVPEGATLESLLRRLPGMEVSQDGSVLADGKNVTRLTVEGKTFFSEDPKFAIKNLPAEGVSKIQVFDKKDEEALLTGVSQNTTEKAMNIELKEGFKKGGFGKITAGGGIETRGELKGNYNKFDNKYQFSMVGVGNNTGRNGLSWDDYQDFMGSNSWNLFNDYTYGFGTGGGYFISFSGSSGLENKIQDAFFSGDRGGFPTHLIGGLNYNYDHKKTKLSSRYFFQQSGNEKETFLDSRNFLPDAFLENNRFESESRMNGSHRTEFVFEHKIDSLFAIKATADVAFVGTDIGQFGHSDVFKNGIFLSNNTSFNNDSELTGRLFSTSILARKQFKKKGRGLGANLAFLQTNVQEDQNVFSDNFFFSGEGDIEQELFLRQLNDDQLNKKVISGNFLVSEPFSKKIFFKTFINMNVRLEEGSRLVEDENNEGSRVLDEFLSRSYDNRITNQRIGTSLTYTHQGLNITVGGAYQVFNLQGDFSASNPELFEGVVDNRFSSWIPFAEMQYPFSRNTYFNTTYTIDVREPSIEQLLPVIDFRNPLFIREGNPDLLPALSHRLSLSLNHSWPASGIRISVYGWYNYQENQIISEQIVDENQVTFSRPINFTGGRNLSMYSNMSLPIQRNKLTFRFTGRFMGSRSFAVVNNVLNRTLTTGPGGSLGLDYTPTQNTALFVSTQLGYTNTTYNINSGQNQNIIQNTHSFNFSTKISNGLFLNSSLRYSVFSNKRFGIEQRIPIANLSVYKQLLRGNRGEIRVSIYDVFNSNIMISQNTSATSVFDSRTLSLARYGLLSFSYNIRGMKSGVNQNMYY
ncbi:MAG TPA: TonB-dependent receptor [Saprospiraceae bacterium]|nr:TonB-dependent receptor [Saprospiraceae bacterium]